MRQRELLLQIWVSGLQISCKSSTFATHIHVHPDVVLFADVRNGDERVKGSVHCCSSCCTHKERYKTLQSHKQAKQNTANMFSSSYLSTVFIAALCASHYLLLGLHYSPLKVSWDHFTTAEEKQDLVAFWLVCWFFSASRSIQIM